MVVIVLRKTCREHGTQILTDVDCDWDRETGSRFPYIEHNRLLGGETFDGSPFIMTRLMHFGSIVSTTISNGKLSGWADYMLKCPVGTFIPCHHFTGVSARQSQFMGERDNRGLVILIRITSPHPMYP